MEAKAPGDEEAITKPEETLKGCCGDCSRELIVVEGPVASASISSEMLGMAEVTTGAALEIAGPVACACLVISSIFCRRNSFPWRSS